MPEEKRQRPHRSRDAEEDPQTSNEALRSLNEELSSVNSRLCRQIEELEASADDLRKRLAETDSAGAHLQKIYDTVREPLLVLGPDLKVRSANASFYETFQVQPVETEGRLIYDLGDRQWDIPKLRELLSEILPDNHAFNDFEVEHDFPGLGRRAMLLNARRVDEIDMILLAIEDVTERKHWEERQKLLLAEVDHRVKNVLTTVQAIASQTIRGAPSLEAFQETFSSRMVALGSAHNLLTKDSWRGAHLGALLDEILRPYCGAAGGRLELRGEDLELTPKAALALSLVINELATNASKYGALSREAGKVEVRWALTGAGDQRHVELTWRESGGPRAKPPAEDGFGLTLIERSISYELDGEARLEFLEGGLRCELLIPHNPSIFGAG